MAANVINNMKLVFSVLLCVIKTSMGDLQCFNPRTLEVTFCYGTGAYCCSSHGSFIKDQCCYQLWGFWWFWMLWVFAIMAIISCGFWCRRHLRNRRENYVILGQPTAFLAGPAPSMYGTVDRSTPTYITAAHPASSPVAPPAYTDQKPPAYTGI